MQNAIYANPISSRLFTWNKGDKTFVAEASDLGPGFRTDNPLFRDACDIGFTMKSTRTGKMVRFVRDQVIKDQDNDVALWTFTAYAGDIGQTIFVRAIIFND